MTTEYYSSFNAAIKAALRWLKSRGVVDLVEPYEAKMGGFGMRTRDRSSGYRIEFDERSNAHINVYTHSAKGPHHVFPGNRDAVRSVWRQLFMWDTNLKRRG